MAIDCDHERPKLNLPRTTPPQLGWQVPSYLSPDPNEFRRQVLEALQGIYLEQSRRFATPAIIPLLDVSYDIPPGSVIRGVADGQTINLLPPALGSGANSITPTTFIIDDVVTPITVTFTAGNGQPTSATIGVAGVHDFTPGTDGGYQTPPGSSGPLGAGMNSDRLLGRDTPGLGVIEELSLGAGLTFTGVGSVDLSPIDDDQALVNVSGGVATPSGVALADFGGTRLTYNAGTHAFDVDPLVIGDLPSIADDRVLANIAGVSAPPTAVALANFGGTNLTYNATTHAFDVSLASVTYLAGDGLDLTGLTFSVDVSDFAGTGLEDDGSENLRISSSAAGLGLTGGSGSALAVGEGAGISVGANDVALANIADDAMLVNISGTSNPPSSRFLSQMAGSGLDYNFTTHAWDVDFTGVTYTAGDGIDLSGLQLSADVSDFAGTGLEDDGANNLRIASSAAGSGLVGGSGSALAVGAGDGIDVAANSIAADVSDFAGQGLEDDGANNLRISTAAAGGGLGGGGGVALFVQSSIDSNARVAVRANSGATAGTRRRINFIQSGATSISAVDDSGSEEVDVTISSTDTNTTYSAGDGINLVGTTFSVDAADLTSTSIVQSANNFQRAALTGDVTASQNSNATTIANDAVSNAKMANMGQATFKGRAAGAGTGDPTDLTASQATEIISNQAQAMNNNARVGVRANSTGSTFIRRRINFIAGSGISISISDDSSFEEVDVTITNTGL